jgi:hypothetical protein
MPPVGRGGGRLGVIGSFADEQFLMPWRGCSRLPRLIREPLTLASPLDDSPNNEHDQTDEQRRRPAEYEHSVGRC